MKPKYHSSVPVDVNLPRMPAWVKEAACETPEDVAFLSGAGLAHLHLVVTGADTPMALMRARLALQAAEACAGFAGRLESLRELRDEVHFLRPGDTPGPAGEIALHWQHAVARKITAEALHRALPTHPVDQIDSWLQTAQATPVGAASEVLAAVLADHPQQEAAALILADARLAMALGWDHMVPLLAAGLKRRDLYKEGEALRLACHRAVIRAAGTASRLASDLARRSARLNAVAPKLRTKTSDAAVDLFLSRDAVTPAGLTHLMSARAARRFCDRLVTLGVVQELTGRETFRMYGV